MTAKFDKLLLLFFQKIGEKNPIQKNHARVGYLVSFDD